MPPVKDMTGLRFGRLTVIGRAPGRSSGQALWLCECDCGGTATPNGHNLRAGTSRSCGCITADINRARNQSHGMSRHSGKRGHPLYDVWVNIKGRCYTPTDAAYKRYGGRGITMAEEWQNDFPRFVADVGERPEGNYSLDRIDNDGNYEPGNVRWATPQEQADNRGPVATLTRENEKLKADLAWAVQRIRELEAGDARVRAACFASDDGSEYEHEHGLGEGYPECPACWAHDIRRALDGES